MPDVLEQLHPADGCYPITDKNTKLSQPTTISQAREMTFEDPPKSSEHPPSTPQRRKSSIENLKVEAAHAVRETDSHWYTRVTRPEAVNRRSSSLSLDMRDSILEFKDQDGSYASGCNHLVLEGDPKCFCKSKHSTAVPK